ncbi:MAG: GlsB/YeaQ/YmgE family stress response membrane protein [Actinomycetota bacterium]|nr:GlsB/YeaQ/YmgE family stress response membrane protein [Actinomycetota bacterium]
MLSSIIGTIIVGAIIGALGRLILPGKQNISIVVTIIIGIIASLVGGIIIGATAYNNNNGGIPWFSLLVGAILAALGIVLYGRMSSKRV